MKLNWKSAHQNDIYLVKMGTKGNASIKIIAQGEPSTNNYLPNNSAITTVAEVISRIQRAGEAMPEMWNKYYEQLEIEENDRFAIEDAPPNLLPLLNESVETTFFITHLLGGKKHPTLKGHSELIIESYTLPSVDAKSLQAYFLELFADLSVEVQLQSFRQGYVEKMDVKRVHSLIGDLKRKSKKLHLVPYLSYENWHPNFMKLCDFLSHSNYAKTPTSKL
ncbi:hypothetical protein ACFSCX_20720 [Bacillus salitolerans]|uniref:Uncharacterized protein n=1 Tax=Bacillus salitolerans TaxID=1437434 RepID=A0ABW4LVV1_9BACI